MYKYIYWYKFVSPDQDYKPVILLTGCNSGIGLAAAKLLAEQKQYRVIITARDKHMDHLKAEFNEDERLWVLPLDIINEESRLNLVNTIFKRWGRVDIFVNNSDICHRASLEDTPDSDDLLHMQKNYLGPISLIRKLLPKMRENGKGKIINVSSVSGMLAFPLLASYSASKFAIEGALESLWYETRPFGVDVALVQPGFIKSVSHQKMKLSPQALDSNHTETYYSDMYHNMIPFFEKMMDFGLSKPDSIAELIYNVIRTEQPPLWVPASFDAEIFYYLKRWLPRRLVLPFFYWILPNSESWGKKFSRKHQRSWIKRTTRNILRFIGRKMHQNYKSHTSSPSHNHE